MELPIVISPYAPAREVLIRRDRASTIPGVQAGASGLVFEREYKEDMRIHLFVDRSIVEIFINGRAALTTCVYPGPQGDRHGYSNQRGARRGQETGLLGNETHLAGHSRSGRPLTKEARGAPMFTRIRKPHMLLTLTLGLLGSVRADDPNPGEGVKAFYTELSFTSRRARVG